MNWRTILGLVLLIVGIRAFYIAMQATSTQASYIKIASFVWIAVGVLLVVKSMTKKQE